jgi:hypothetical protein
MADLCFENIMAEFAGATAQGEFRRATELLADLRTSFDSRSAGLSAVATRTLVQDVLSTLDRTRKETLARRAHLSQTLRSLPAPNPYTQRRNTAGNWDLHG